MNTSSRTRTYPLHQSIILATVVATICLLGPAAEAWEKRHEERPRAVIVPAGSVDALAAAITEAGPHGKVILERGVHSETGTVEINHPVSIVGERGAILESSTTGSTSSPLRIEPALHIKDASRTRVRNIVFRPAGADATCGIVVEDSSHVRISGNGFTGFKTGILVQQGDHVRIHGNEIETEPFTGATPNNGIVIINGRFARIWDNSVSNAFAGIFCGSERGRGIGNHVEGNVVGMLLCTPSFLYEISGEVAVAEAACIRWILYGNVAEANSWGYLVIDGANKNFLVNNYAEDNALYDVELAGDSERFGFFTPTSSENAVIQRRRFGDLLVKDCGLDNRVFGNVTMVDLSVDPCF